MKFAARLLEELVQIVRQAFEALLVVRLAPQSGNSEVVSRGTRAYSAEKDPEKAEAEEPALFHTSPHLRRRIHSDAGSSRISRKIAGIFQSSLA